MSVVTHSPDSNVQRHALLVLGMHRSGTSALTNLLVHLGAEPPRTLMQPNHNNPLGFWESQNLCAVHDRLLNGAGSSWDAWTALDAVAFERAAAQEPADEIRRLLGQEFGGAPLLVIKDPRICRFVPFWVSRLVEEGISPAPILIIRGPLAVARSLELASGVARNQALLMWLRHTLDAERATRDMPRSIVRYRDLLANPVLVADQISRDLRIAWPVTHLSEEEIAVFLKPELCHHAVEVDTLDAVTDLESWLDRVHRTFDGLVSGSVSPEAAFAAFDDVRTEFDRMSAIFGPPLEQQASSRRTLAASAEAMRQDRERLAHERSLLLDENLGLRDASTRLVEIKTRLETERDRFASHAVALQAERDRLSGRNVALQTKCDRLTGQAAAIEANRGESRRQISWLDPQRRDFGLQVIDLEHQNEALMSELNAVRQHAGQLLTSASWRVTAPLRTAASLVGVTAASLITAKAMLLGRDFYGALEAPADGSVVVGTLEIGGWALSRSDAVDHVEALIDRTPLGLLPFGLERADIARIFQSSAAAGSGYGGAIVLDHTLHGPHTLAVRIFDRLGRHTEYCRRITIQPAAIDTTIEEPPPKSPSQDRLPVTELMVRPTLDHANPASSEPRLLVITDAIPTPDLDSGSFRLFQILEALTELGYVVSVISHSEERPAQYLEPLTHMGIETFFGHEAAMVHLMTEGHRYSYVWLSRPEITFRYLFPVRAGAINATVAYDTVDLHWLRWQRAAQLLGDEGLLNQAAESKIVERFNALGSDIVIAITESEKRVLLETDPSLAVEIIPNIHPRLSGPSATFRTRRDLMFIGGFQHVPNEDAVCYFVRDIWPLITRELSDVVFNIVGSKLSERVRQLESSSVRIVGYVPDPSSYFEQSRVFVSPLRYGAGMKGKIGQAMSFGVPVVTTSIGAEGLLLVDGENALIADRPDDFARAVVCLYTDENSWLQISANAVAHVERHFSPAEARRRLKTLFPFPSSVVHDHVVAAGSIRT